MQRRTFLIVSLILLLMMSLFIGIISLIKPFSSNDTPKVFVGVDIAYNDLVAAKKLVDQVSSYVNLIVVGNTEIAWNVTKANEMCQYIYDKGLYFIYFTGPTYVMKNQGDWVDSARAKWGSRFIGLYIIDEWGGKQLDQDQDMVVTEAANYSDASSKFVYYVNQMLLDGQQYNHAGNLTTLTSDYTFYWFEYKAGYDAILAQFGWNYSRQLNVALCRGAATAYDREWGVMITWTYTQPPYLESGGQLYDDMVLAYRNGAKYILVFDSNENYTGEILQQQHFGAFKKFKDYMYNNPQPVQSPSERIAYVLPKDYAYGFRGPNDKIWGLWQADNMSYELSRNVGTALEEFGAKLDVIYDDGIPLGSTLGYSSLIFWNGTVYNAVNG